jgi:flagellar hook protein FlgE
MGLASALSTALTGLTAAETTIDVVGNNLANANTVGFKSSQAAFATQFLQTQSLGSAPTTHSGGTNPRQIGLGTMVAAITPNFNQGTIQISANPTDMAVQGDGFFIVQGASGEQLYTRNGIFKLNAQSQLVTITGHRLLGYGVDDQYQIQTTGLVPLTIPLGAAAVAKATENVYLEGTLSPTGNLADRSEIIQSAVLGDLQWSAPATALTAQLAPPENAPSAAGLAPAAISDPGGAMTDGVYHYKIVFADFPWHADPLRRGTEGWPSTDHSLPVTIDNGAGQNAVEINGWPADPTDTYQYVRFYRTHAGADPADPDTTYYYAGEELLGKDPPQFTDIRSDAQLGAALDATSVVEDGGYTYYVTFRNRETGRESRPSPLSSEFILSADGRIRLLNIPEDASGQYHERVIYRNPYNDNSNWQRVGIIPTATGATTFTDRVGIDGLGPEIDRDGPKIGTATLLKDVIRRDGSTYERVFDFEPGTTAVLQFTGRKGGRSLATKEFTITDTTTVLELINFMEQALGIQRPPGSDPRNPIPSSLNPVPGEPNINPGGLVTGGKIQLTGNTGTGNAIGIGLAGLRLVTSAGDKNINMPFSSIQTAVGESALADFVAYDSLGIPLSVRLTAVLESRTSTATTYRWYADSPNNDPETGVRISVGTGLIRFDGEGNFTSATASTVSIDRRHVSSASPLEFDLNFNQISGLATAQSSLAVSRQDGSAPGVLTSFIVGEDGRIRGVFSNGITRDLGQIRLARFGNPTGLEQKGENMFAAGVNSGLPVEGNPNEQGIGTIIAGAQELSNTDIGSNLIDLILASTMYRGNTRVITTAQQMLDELLALRR